MPFRFQKRIALGKGVGLNVSTSGVSASVRTRKGSIGTKGFTLQTGIPGLIYKSSWTKSSKQDGLLLLTVLFSVIILVGWNVVRLTLFLTRSAYNWMTRSISKH